jgi:hypothetical protein
MTQEKTHWLASPNKNYLGNWDLPNGMPALLTISFAGWEKVKNPITGTSEAKRVIKFKEKAPWVKPFICNQVNAQNILKSTGEKFMEDCEGKVIKLFVTKTKVKGEEVDCLRVDFRKQNQSQGVKINDEQASNLESLIEQSGRDKIDWCKAVGVNSINDVPLSKYEGYAKRLNKIIEENEDN